MRKNPVLSIIIFFLLTGCLSQQVNNEAVIDNKKKYKGSCDIANGDFNNKNINWNFWIDRSAQASVNFENNEAEIDIKNPGIRTWHVILAQDNLLIEKGYVYNVSFDARSSTNFKINCSVGMSGDPYYRYSGIYSYTLTGKMKNYSYDFTMMQDTNYNSRIQFTPAGLTAGNIVLDNIKVTKLRLKEELYIPGTFIKPGTDMKRGIQFGTSLAAPQEGAWDNVLEEEYFDLVKGLDFFDHIRIPVRWETHTDPGAPYTIDPEFLKKVDWAVSNALSRGFYVIINMHHHTDLETNPQKNEKKFLSIWSQISEYFKDYPEWLFFEIYNEPHGNFDKYWNKFYPEAYNVIRKTNPDRKIIITGPSWGNIDFLPKLKLPGNIINDPDIIVQFHYYNPYKFCFQGSPGNGCEDISGIRWQGTDKEKQKVIDLLDSVIEWSKKNNNVKLWNGEFTAHKTHPYEKDRLAWINFVVSECEKRNIPWNYWDFSGNVSFIYEKETKTWDYKLLEALGYKK